MFKKAERRKAKLRLALCGPSGSGKTYSALLIAKGIGGKIALLDTENGSGSLYSNICEYDSAEIAPPFAVEKYISSIKAAENAGYNVLIIDSLSHAWAGQGGLLEEVDKRNKGNSFTAWREVTPMHNKLVDTILQSSLHIITTMRSKTAYEIEKDERGKVVPVKKGMAPIQRDGLEYEFTVVLDLDNKQHTAVASKDRTGLFDNKVIIPNEETGQMVWEWLDSGAEPLASEIQARELLEETKKIGVPIDEMKAIIYEKYGVASSKEMTIGQVKELITSLDNIWKSRTVDKKAI